ncbi:hypothetical protein PVL29_021185 [Vitis rotundifolia]|uniref:Uncharacterized protein n=1 Tax=Vitis rotundifolia TaxID=103349 RepID=A0AA38YYS4_VITRO|nr:hypothetical protein PVL29_021185 [Vitis rotundifolia]
MVRGKIQMRRIENATSRQVTFSKRRNGLLKKAYELSVLCDAEVAVIIFSQKGRLYEFSSSKYNLKQDTESMAKKIELLEVSQRKLLGQGLSSCSLDEILEIDGQLEKSLKNIRARKAQIFQEQIEQLKEREKQLLEENARLSQKDTRQWQLSAQPSEGVTYSQSSPSSEVVTELFIGLPEMRCS